MEKENVGILNPGQMGISIAATMQNSSHNVHWASAGRSRYSLERAKQFNLIDSGSIEALVETCSMVVCVCPPGAASAVAEAVIKAGFKGLYIDANAISPNQVIRIGESMASAGIEFVDGSIIGGPAWEPGRTWLYLSGKKAETAAGYFHAGPLGTRIMDENIGKASAIKMCFAAYTKGSRALMCGILGLAEKLDVLEDLQNQWSPEFTKNAVDGAVNVTAKAWRFVAEMEEISKTFQEAGMPGGFHEAAAEVYRRIAQFKDADPLPAFEQVLLALTDESVR